MEKIETRKYRITGTAGPFVNGRPSPGADAEVELTEEEARYLLLNGEIEPATDKRAPAKLDKAAE